MTIFGFNTDVKCGELLYHVQSEARQNDLLLQTLVFVKGQCVGKHTVSYAQRTLQPDFSERGMHELLKAQHKNVIDAIQQGQLESFLDGGTEIQDVDGSGLSLKWTGANEGGGGSITATLQVLDSGQPAAGAEIVVRPCIPASSPPLARATSDTSGGAKVEFTLTEELLQDPAVIVEASCGGKSATRKFRFKRQLTAS